ncbi:MAG: DedA family protein [Rikenellaceae bacterium]|jgi:membrane protein YqaA with SNARE-associated domain|nr:DedA family protein [Rikenellaceae bacterium]
MRIIRRLYDWVLGWSKSRWGAVALFCIAFAESSFFPVPPDVLLIALCLGLSARSLRYAAICTAGSLLGAILGYGIGHYLWQTPGVADFFFDVIPGFSHESYRTISGLYDKYNFWVVFTMGFTPLPYKVATITAGIFNINFVMFLLASTVSRGARFFLIAWLIWRFGQPVKTFIDKYFNWLALAFTVLLVGSFLLIGCLL